MFYASLCVKPLHHYLDFVGSLIDYIIQTPKQIQMQIKLIGEESIKWIKGG